VAVVVVGQDKLNQKPRKERLLMKVNCTLW
jgi:hypothetical protein